MEPYTPKFHWDARVYPMYKADGTTPNADHTYWTTVPAAELATKETADWVAANFGGNITDETYLGIGKLEDPQGNEIRQYMLNIERNGKVFHNAAGRVAWYFSVQPNDKAGDENAGYWKPGFDAATVMYHGKIRADQFIEAGLVEPGSAIGH